MPSRHVAQIDAQPPGRGPEIPRANDDQKGGGRRAAIRGGGRFPAAMGGGCCELDTSEEQPLTKGWRT
ncbi:hypothetical protein IMZ48_20705 [Candidatus Bathyarchaeota archaeon]|nr:hypothetical protein [Candidatus Bathyarchaeota archaeon]